MPAAENDRTGKNHQRLKTGGRNPVRDGSGGNSIRLGQTLRRYTRIQWLRSPGFVPGFHGPQRSLRRHRQRGRSLPRLHSRRDRADFDDCIQRASS